MLLLAAAIVAVSLFVLAALLLCVGPRTLTGLLRALGAERSLASLLAAERPELAAAPGALLAGWGTAVGVYGAAIGVAFGAFGAGVGIYLTPAIDLLASASRVFTRVATAA